MIRIYGSQDQKEFSNEFWYSISAGSPGSMWDQHAAAGAFYSAIGTPLIATMCGTCKLIGCEMYYNDGTGTVGAAYYSTLTNSSVFSGIPEDVAVVIQKLTTNTTKKGRGRWYFAGVGVTEVNDSYLNSTGITNYQALAVQLKTAVTDQSITYSPAHFSPQLGTLIPLKDTPVVALLATRRRRRFGF
jgi:hypothetical protein